MTHDLVDEEIAFRNVDFEMQYLPKASYYDYMAHRLLKAFGFTVYDAHHEEIQTDKVVVLDMTSGDEFDRINKLLTDLKSTG